MAKAEEMLASLPLSGRVIRAVHGILLSGARGANRAPGEYRRTPNWIGPPGCTIEEAKYVPVRSERLADAMSRWERYIHQEDMPDLLVQAANLHAEFEALHPFLDGNGRLGRMLIPLFLWQRGRIARPIFYISAYFEANRDAYYERLLAVSRDNDWTGWGIFFLKAVKHQADDNLAKTQGILNLYDDLKPRIDSATKSRHTLRTLDWIFQKPVFSSTSFARGTSIPAPSAHRILTDLQAHGILQKTGPLQVSGTIEDRRRIAGSVPRSANSWAVLQSACGVVRSDKIPNRSDFGGDTGAWCIDAVTTQRRSSSA